MIVMKSTTNLRKTNKSSVALSTQVPREIMNALDLSEGDKMNWIIEAVDSSLIVKIEKSVE
ncbi:MAG: hypothetical protein LBB45_09090 [Methanobrevibacter sp.]|nr:hypothetical protein [Candidatus Methanovirga basalitermitum]